MNTLDWDFESLVGENLYRVTGPQGNGLVRVERCGYRNNAECISLTEPLHAFYTRLDCPCKDSYGLLTTIGDIIEAEAPEYEGAVCGEGNVPAGWSKVEV